MRGAVALSIGQSLSRIISFSVEPCGAYMIDLARALPKEPAEFEPTDRTQPGRKYLPILGINARCSGPVMARDLRILRLQLSDHAAPAPRESSRPPDSD
jgi:hypothetical protein